MDDVTATPTKHNPPSPKAFAAPFSSFDRPAIAEQPSTSHMPPPDPALERIPMMPSSVRADSDAMQVDHPTQSFKEPPIFAPPVSATHPTSMLPADIRSELATSRIPAEPAPADIAARALNAVASSSTGLMRPPPVIKTEPVSNPPQTSQAVPPLDVPSVTPTATPKKKSHKAKSKQKPPADNAKGDDKKEPSKKDKGKEKEREGKGKEKEKERLVDRADRDDEPTEDRMEVDEEEDLDQQLTKKEKRHKEFSERLDKLNRDFAENKERIFADKIAAFKQEVREVQQGVHPDFEEAMQRLERQRDQTIRQAELFRDYQLERVDILYHQEHQATITEYNNERQGLREKMLNALEDRKRKLREDRESFDLNNFDATIEATKTIGTRKTTRAVAAKHPEERKEKRRKAAGSSLQSLVFVLAEPEINDDINLLRRAANAAQKKLAPAAKPAKK
ncbi:hypothetical protein HDV00_005790 [Rhizophlyctis rosea]|nr:hypothetical protein HDV00_005790 [Rhizophlyctis rosea]